MKFKILILFLLVTKLTFGQINNYKFIGTIISDNLPPISFKLDLNEQEGRVSGFSLTNINSQDQTTSEVQGIYLKKSKTFQINETQIISTSSESPINSFCYLNMTLELKEKRNKKFLEGNFIGNFLDSSSCAKGKIILMEEDFVNKKLKKINKKIEKFNKKNFPKKDTNTILITKTITDKNNFEIQWESKFLTLNIWDSNKEDGDRINLTINNEIVLLNYTTKNKPKKIKYRLRKGKNVLKIKAVSTGALPPNTSRIELIDNKIKYPLISELELNKTAEIIIFKIDPN
jgi:hypothetical protein|tara:strand:- start:5492 stop:6355 length:864 start_codon:yes stop_codon:yes gene_type:complete